MKKNSKLIIFGIAIGIIFLFFGFSWASPIFFPANDIYRSPGTSSTGHTIKISEDFSVVTTNARDSYLWFLIKQENPVTLVKHINKLNYDDNYIIVQAITKNFDSLFLKKYNYCIVNKATQEVNCYSKKSQFLTECKKRDINVELKIKEKFDWY